MYSYTQKKPNADHFALEYGGPRYLNWRGRSNAMAKSDMRYLLGYGKSLYAYYEVPVAGIERPYEEWNYFISKIVFNLCWTKMEDQSITTPGIGWRLIWD